VFFYSSRRRQTRFSRDWSSDVCSSDLPAQLGLGPGDTVVIPTLCYPTYEVGARLAGARIVRADTPDDAPETARLVWLNSPANPRSEERRVGKEHRAKRTRSTV